MGKRVSSVPAFRMAKSGLSCEKPSKGGRSHAVTNRTSLARSSLLKEDTASQKYRMVGVFSSADHPL